MRPRLLLGAGVGMGVAGWPEVEDEGAVEVVDVADEDAVVADDPGFPVKEIMSALDK